MINFLFIVLYFTTNILSKHHVFINDSDLISFRNDFIEINDLEGSLYRKKIKFNNINFSEYDILLNEGDTIFLKKSGGLVYRLKNDSIKRIDYSYDHKLQHKSLTFFHQNKLYKFGGYGFFERRNLLTHFDFHTSEWVLDEFKEKDNKLLPFSNVDLYFISNNKLYFFGYEFTPENNYKTSKSFRSHMLDLEKMELKYIGDYNHNLINKSKGYFELNDQFSLSFEDNRILKIDKTSLKFQIFPFDHIFKRIIGEYNDTLYIELKNNKSNKYLKIGLEDFLKKGQEFDILQKSKNKIIGEYTVIILLIILMFITYLYFVKFKNKLIFTRNKVYFDYKILNNFFTKEEVSFIHFLSHKNSKFTNNEILEYFGKSYLDINHQNRLKKDFIDTINFKSESILNKKLIIKSPNIRDGRMNNYKMNKELLVFIPI